MLQNYSAADTVAPSFPRLKLSKLELQFRDGSSVWLQQMRGDDPCVRCIDLPYGERIEVDLRDIAPSLDGDVAAAPNLDRAGTLFFTLRHQFADAGAFVKAAKEHAR